jgi:DNA-binding MarR family transcriptional regulator
LLLSNVEDDKYAGHMPVQPVAHANDHRREQFHEIARLLFEVTEQMRRSFEAICARLDLTPPLARALLALGDKGSMRSLADVLGCDASNVTGITDRLEAKGLVRRESAEGDRRVKLLALTPSGKRLRRRLEVSIEDQSPVTVGLAGMERETLRELLAKLAASTQDTTRIEEASGA